MIKHETRRFSPIINEVEVVEGTKETFSIKYDKGVGTIRKTNSHVRIWDTETEAKAFLVSEYTEKIKLLAEELKKFSEELEQITK